MTWTHFDAISAQDAPKLLYPRYLLVDLMGIYAKNPGHHDLYRLIRALGELQ